MTPLLEVAGIAVRYRNAVAVDGVSLSIAPGERVALVGANGAGKTSLLKAISGMVRPSSGSVRIDGRDVTNAQPGTRVRLGVSQTPEGRQVFPSLSVEANLLLGAFGRTGPWDYLSSRHETRRDLERVYALLPALRELRHRPAGRTSGGQQQMLAIGRSLMARPRLLAIDELSLGLAPVVVRDLAAFLRELNEEDGVAILLVEQNAKLALELTSRAYVMSAGHIALEGPSEELRRERAVVHAYLGGRPRGDG